MKKLLVILIIAYVGGAIFAGFDYYQKQADARAEKAANEDMISREQAELMAQDAADKAKQELRLEIAAEEGYTIDSVSEDEEDGGEDKSEKKSKKEKKEKEKEESQETEAVAEPEPGAEAEVADDSVENSDDKSDDKPPEPTN